MAIDLTGKRFGAWVVLGPAVSADRLWGGKRKYATWYCVCDCGGRRRQTSEVLVRGKSKRCQSCANPTGFPAGFGSPAVLRCIINGYKNSAKARGHEFAISNEHACLLLTSNCHYCAVPPSAKRYDRRRKFSVLTNGIDRTDNSGDYTYENSVPCCRRCNAAKSTSSVDEFLLWAVRIHFHQTDLKQHPTS